MRVVHSCLRRLRCQPSSHVFRIHSATHAPCTFRARCPSNQIRHSSSLNRLLFERDQEETRPLLPDVVLTLAQHGTADKQSHVSVKLDGSSHDLSHVYLRDSCQCAKCVDPGTTQKTFNTGDIKNDVAPSALRIIKNSLEIVWNDGHRSIYPAKFLNSYVDREAATQTRHNAHEPVVWDGQEIASFDISTPYKSFMASDAATYQVISTLARYGLAFLESCPSGTESEAQLQNIVERVGPLKSTFYGPTWNVRAVEGAKNVAYTSVDLDLHMDLLYYESPPGLQFLHCLQNEVEGGSSVFVDSFKVAEVMRAQHRHEFDVLCKHKVDFKYDNDGVYYHQSRPTFVLNQETGHLEYVNYSPPFQGVQVAKDFAEYHHAISIFAKLLASDEYRYELILKPGQCVIFNNRRTLHARRAFGPGNRWLKGAYADIDVLWSKYRTGLEHLIR